MNPYTYIRHLAVLVAFLLVSFVSFGQGKAVPSEAAMVKNAQSLYEQGRYREACEILMEQSKHQNVALHSRIMTGITIFLLIDIIGVFFFLYIEKRKAYKLLVDRNADCAQRPMFDPHTIDFSAAETDGEEDKELLESLHQLFEKDKIHLSGDLKIDMVAQKLNTTRAVVSKLTNQYLGRSFPALVNQYRINEAVRLLLDPKTSNYKLDAIGSLCGFNNRQVFHAAFKKETGLTPLEFKHASTSND